MLRISAVVTIILVMAALWALTPDSVAAETKTIDGDPYACTYEGLRKAVNEAADGDTIQFACPSPSNDLQLTNGWITIEDKAVTIDGSNGDYDQIVFYQSDNDSETINQRFLTVEPSGGLTIKNATFKRGFRIGDNGGAIYSAGSLQVEGCTFTGNKAQYGGAIYSDDGGSTKILGSTFTGNLAVADGGGGNGAAAFVQSSAQFEIKGSSFTDNRADSHGGAVFVDNDGEVRVTDSTFTRNISPENGGAFYLDNPATLTAINTSFFENKGVDGAAIFSDDDGTVNLTGGTFSDNTATSNGGGVFLHEGSKATIDGVDFVENSATESGAALFLNNETQATVTNSSFENNGSETVGAAAFVDDDATLTVEATTFSDNHATNSGGAIYSQGALILKSNTEFLRNQSSDGGALYIDDIGIFESTGTIFTDNHATGTNGSDGGALFLAGTSSDSGRPYLVTGATFTNNTSKDDGGAIYVTRDGQLSVSSSTFTANETVLRVEEGQQLSGDGGAIHNLGILEVTASSFTNNRSSHNDAGAIYNDAKLAVRGSTFTDNWTAQSGAAIYSLTNSSLQVDSSVFISNHAVDSGGAIDAGQNTDSLIRDSLFQGNTTQGTGGAIDTRYGSMEIKQSSFVENHADESGGAIFNGGNLNIVSSTLSQNTAADAGSAIDSCDCDGDQQTTVRWSTIVQSSTPAVGIDVPFTFDGVILTGQGDACIFHGPESLLSSSNSIADDDSCGLASGITPRPIVGLRTSIYYNGVQQFFHPVVRNGAAHDTGGNSCLSPDQLGSVRPQGAGCEIGAIENIFFDYEPVTLCANQWNGALTMAGQGGCGRGDIEISIPTVDFEPVELCVNNWNGAVRLMGEGSDCGRSEHLVAVDGFGDVSFCVNNWNGTLRVSDTCSRSEHQLQL